MAKRITRASTKFLPASLAALGDVEADGPDILWHGKKLKRVHLADIVDLFIGRYYMFKKHKVNLHSEKLRQKYGTWYNFYLDYLLHHDILTLESNYSAGIKSNTYKLHARWKSEGLVEVVMLEPVSKSTKVILERNQSSIEEPVRDKLIEDLKHVTLSSGALKWIEEHREALGVTKYFKNRYTITKMMNGERRHSFCKYGRMHHEVSVVKREVRQLYIRIDGSETAELDIGNSQPFFLYLSLLENGFEDWDGFDDDVLEERLYDRMQAEGGLKDRKTAKRAVYRVLFGTTKSNHYTRAFTRLYPRVWEKICQIKRDAHDHAALAHQLQRAESNFLYNNAIKRLMVELPHVRIITVHDSLIVPVEHKSRVELLFDIYQHELLLETRQKAEANKKARSN